MRDRELSQLLYLSSQSTRPHQQSRTTPHPLPLKKQQPAYSSKTTGTLVRPLQSELSLWSGQMRSDFIPQHQATFPGSVYLFTLMCIVNQACTVCVIIAQTRQTLPCTGVLSVTLALVLLSVTLALVFCQACIGILSATLSCESYKCIRITTDPA